MNLKLLTGVICTLTLLQANSQRCATSEYLKAHPVNNYDLSFAQSTGGNTRDTLSNEVIIIPVVIHILYNTNTQNISDAQVLSQLDVLNKDYRRLNTDNINVPAAFASVTADTRISFCIARVDPKGRPTKGIVRKYTSIQIWSADDAMKFSASNGDDAWDSKKYLNIWVCNLFNRTLGYSSVPASSPDRDGIVIQYDVFGNVGTLRYPYNKGRTATHEVGHWLGLKHLWGDADCGDDGIADTPPQRTYNNGCPSFPHTSACSVNGNGDMFMNYMDFTDDACMDMFTQEQKIKMRSMFAVNGSRNSFLSSVVCDSAQAVGGPLPADSAAVPVVISLYPNPASTYITIESKQTNDLIGKTIKVINVLGREVLSKVLSSQKNTIAISHLPAGIYFVRIDNNLTLKFIKQ